MDAVDKQPESTARRQRAIDLRIEARLAFVSFGSIEEWFRCRVATGRRGPGGLAMKDGGLPPSRSGRRRRISMERLMKRSQVAEEAVALANQMNNAHVARLLSNTALANPIFWPGDIGMQSGTSQRRTALLTSAPENVLRELDTDPAFWCFVRDERHRFTRKRFRCSCQSEKRTLRASKRASILLQLRRRHRRAL